MVGSTEARLARRLRRARFALLALGGLLFGHTAVYVVAYGGGTGFAQAMRLGGHDAYWPVFAGAALAALAVLAFDGLHGLLRAIHRPRPAGEAIGAPGAPGLERAGEAQPADDYLTELLDLWGPLFLVVGAGFFVQENLESALILHHLPLLGIYTTHLLAAPLLALVTGLLAALGALVRWRIAVLTARARPPAQRWQRPVASLPHRRWNLASAALAARWMLLRQDAGRAPPILSSVGS